MYPHLEESELQRRVKLYLAATRPELGRLIVQTDGNTVRLSGELASFYLRQLAIGAVKRVAGVQNVADEIEVPMKVHGRRDSTEPARPRLSREEPRYAAVGCQADSLDR
jgi:hypothetical protein